MKINALEYICEKILNSEDFNNKYDRLLENNFNYIFQGKNTSIQDEGNIVEKNMLKYCDFLSSSKYSKNKNLALKLISLVDEVSDKNEYKELIKKTILTKFGLFLAVDKFTSSDFEVSATESIVSTIRKNIQIVSGTNETFTNSQFYLYNEILKEQFFSFSGPTSIGKSFLIKKCAIELVGNGYNNVVFILPTKALLDEFVIDFRKIINELKIDNLNVGKTVSSFRHDRKNILVLTQERYNGFLYNTDFEKYKIDVLFVDEAHKLLDKKNTRAMTLFKVINRSLNKFPEMKLIFSCPVISNPDVLFTIFNIKGKSNVVKETPVSQSLYFVNLDQGFSYSFDSITNKKLRFQLPRDYNSDYDFIYSIGSNSDSNLIYFSNKMDCIDNAIALKNYFVSIGVEPERDKELLEESSLISHYIHNDFLLAELLKYKIAFHHGGLPIFIRKRIEDLYSKKKLQFIFCTSTLLEGVNLPTKNIFIYPFKVSENDVSTKLSFWNLAGRAGRYKNELTGNIFCINRNDKNFDEQVILKESDVVLNDTLIKPISVRRLLNYLTDNVKSPDIAVVQLSNIILSEVLSYQVNGNLGPYLLSIPYANRSKLIEAGVNHLENKKIRNIDISIFSENHTIKSEIQSKAYSYAKNIKNTLNSFKRNDFFIYTEMINNIYGIFSKNSLGVMQILAYSWIRGKSIREIINDSIKYSSKVRVGFDYLDFDKNNIEHINNKITQIIYNIENDIGFKLETSVNHFYQLCKSIHGEANAGINLSKFIEYGTIDLKDMAIQEYGFSRVASIQLLKKYSHFLLFDEDEELLSIDLVSIIENSKDNLLIYRESKWLI